MHSPVPYAIEERQYYFISKQDNSLEPFGERSLIFRGADILEEDYIQSHWSWYAEDDGGDDYNDDDLNQSVSPSREKWAERKTHRSRVHTRIGPALYTIDGLKDEEQHENETSGKIGAGVWDNYYAMAMYFSLHPDIISGKGLEVGR